MTVAAVSVATFAIAIPAFAASAGWTSVSLGANTAMVARCDSNGVTLIQNLAGATVASVTVGGIGAACGGAPISVTVDNGSASSTGSSTVPAGGGSLTVILAAPVAAGDADQIDVSINGP